MLKSKLVEKEMVEIVGKKKNGDADDFKKYLRDKTNKSLL